MITNSNLTVLLTLLDRPEYTRRFLANCLWKEFRYLLWDSSKTNLNQSLCRETYHENVNYVRVPPYPSYFDFFVGIRQSLNRVETPFVILADNDDFLIKSGLVEAAQALTRNIGATSASGPVLGFRASANSAYWFYGFPILVWYARGGSGLAEVNASRQNEQGTWYSVFRTQFLIEIFDQMLTWRIKDPYLFEFGLTDLGYLSGLHLQTPSPHYAKMLNQSDRAINALDEPSTAHSDSRAWFEGSDTLDKMLSVKFGIAPSDLMTNALRWSLIQNVISTNPRFWSQIWTASRLMIASVTFLPLVIFRPLLTARLYF